MSTGMLCTVKAGPQTQEAAVDGLDAQRLAGDAEAVHGVAEGAGAELDDVGVLLLHELISYS